MRLQAEPETLDWNRAHTSFEKYVLENVMEGLVTFDDKLQVVPALAKSWTRSADGLTYTFQLRADVKWSDGVRLQAQDFVTSWKRLLSPITASSYAYLLFDVVGARDFNSGKVKDFSKVGILAPNEQTLIVKLEKPLAYWIQLATFWVTFPLRADVIEKNGESWSRPGRMVSLGPYLLQSYEVDSKIVLKANPNYYGKHGNIDQVNILIVKDSSVALNLFQSGKLDVLIDPSAIDIERLKGRVELRTFSYLKTVYFGFSVNNLYVNHPKFRRAVAQAIDRNKLVKVINSGQQAAGSFVPPHVMGHVAQMGLKFDVDAAKKELKASGYDTTRGGKLELLVLNAEKSLMIAQFIQEQLRVNLGVPVEIIVQDNRSFRVQLDLHSRSSFVGSWSADYPDPDNFLSIFLSTGGNNRFDFHDLSIDQKIEKAKVAMTPEERSKAYGELQTKLIETDAVMVPLFYEPNTVLVKSSVGNFHLSPLNSLYFKQLQLQ